MKKFLFVLFILLIVSGAYAQKINLIGGMSLSKYIVEWTGSGPEPIGLVLHHQNSTGFLGGMGIEFKIIKRLRLEADVMHFQKGSQYIPSPGNTIAYDLNTLSIPVLIKFALLSDSLPYILAGGELSIILSHKRNGYDLADSPEKYDYGIILGIGNNIKILGVSLFFEARYHIGLTDIDLEDRIIELEDIKRQTRALAIIVGLKI